MIPIDLSSKTVLVTGALGGLGESIVRRLASAGAHMVLTDILEDREAQDRLDAWNIQPSLLAYHKLDVTQAEETDRTVDALFEKFPQIDTALGHAGGCTLHPFASILREEFDRIVALNFTGQTYFARAVFRQWTSRNTPGHLIFTSSTVGTYPWPNIPAYTSAKAALEMFARNLALDYAARGIRVNIVAPGIVKAGSALKVYEENVEYRNMVHRAIPLGEMTSPQAIADAFVWLSSPLAQEITGLTLRVDGGMSLPRLG